MRLGRGGSINNLYPESLFCEIATLFLHIVIGSKRLNSFFEGESNAQLSLVRSI